MDENIKGSISFQSPTFSFGSSGAINGGFNFDLPLATVSAFVNPALAHASANTQNAQGFLGGVYGKSQSSVNAASERAHSFASANVLAITKMQTESMNTARYLAQRDGCFITTAICEADGKPDDCEELRTLREYRDNVLARTEEGQDIIANYYATAPAIVAAIDGMEKRQIIYAMLRDVYLLPAVDAIKAGNNGEAFCLYQRMVIVAKAIAKQRGQ